MDKQTGPNGFLVVLPGEIIEIPQDSDKSWLTLFYSCRESLRRNGSQPTSCPAVPMRSCGRTSTTTLYATICQAAGVGLLRMERMAILSGKRPQGKLS